MSISRKYQEYLKQFPINIEWRIAQTKDLEGFARDNTTYFGPMIGSMKNGNYGISFQKKSNGMLVIREGSWRQDKMYGKGSAYYIQEPNKKNNGSVIVWKEGEWSEDNLNGKGIIRTYSTIQKIWRKVYIGSFINNFKSGYGVYYFDDMKYEGQFQNDCFQGEGRLTKSEQFFYSGKFKDGRPFGKGLQRRNHEIIVYDQNSIQKVFSINQAIEQFKQKFNSNENKDKNESSQLSEISEMARLYQNIIEKL